MNNFHLYNKGQNMCYDAHENEIRRQIFDTLVKNLKPRTLEVVGDFNPRGNVKTIIRVSL